jgi:tetratricopeptide (TPR) repeat protein
MTSCISDRCTSFRLSFALLASLCVTIAVYWPGLSGDFLFDDYPNIIRNGLVQIDSVSPATLWDAWNSSASDFPNSRPLAMLTFGINHAISGLDPFAFKATNLAFHLLTSLVLFTVVRRLGAMFLQFEARNASPDTVAWWAWLTATLWLLHPLNLSPVLLSVQRMTLLSTMCVLLGLLVYLIGRQRLSNGRSHGLLLVWSTPIFAAFGLLAKENALLLPLLLFVIEWTLLRFRGLDARASRRLRFFFVVVTALPILGAVIYLLTHPGYLGYTGRPFDLTERVLTQTRVLWFYVRLLLSPDISAMGLFHDDVVISRGLLQPWTTLAAVLALLGTTLTALSLRKRLPLLAFAVLFFLAGHALESSVFPLELVYEHRNYLPAVAPLFALAYFPTVGTASVPVSRTLLTLLTGAVLFSLAASTALRAYDWSGFGRLITSEVEHHPASLRANFQYAQLLMAQIDDPRLRDEAERLAREHMRRIGDLDPDNVNGLFGLIVLDLHMGRRPPPDLVHDLAERLRRIPFGQLNVNIEQFPYLVQWHDTNGPRARLTQEQMLLLFDAALENPTLPAVGRAGLYHALRGYYHRVLGDTETAMRYAELAVATVPDNWSLHDRRVRLLAILGRFPEADAALAEAVANDHFELHRADAARLAQLIAAARRGESIPAAPIDEVEPSRAKSR